MAHRSVTWIALVLTVLLPSCTLLQAPPPPAPVPETVPEPPADPRAELLWDEYGVPHIFADDEAALFYAHGWAQMRSHGDLVLRLYGEARGRAAEYWGEGFVQSDVWVHTNGIPGRAANWLAQQSPHMRQYLEAFATGMNDFASRHPDAIGAAWREALPVTALDVLAHQQRVIHYTFLAGPDVAGLVPGRQPAGSAGGAGMRGSNGWAIAPSRTAAGNALLLANPHLPWGDRFTWYEAHLSMPGVNAYGAALVGFPILAIAFNETLGWTHTVNTIDAVDVFEFATLGDAYIFDGASRAFEDSTHVLLVRQADGSVRDMPLRLRRSVHGPVLAERDGRAWALRVAGLDRPHLMQQYWDMMRATDLNSFEAALSWLQLPMFTVIYADRAGNIMHVFNGAVPVRSVGDWSYWRGVVPGDSSTTLWTRTHDYYSLPRVLNPPSGWLQNANDPPWTTTLPPELYPGAYPPYMAPRLPMAFRPQRSARMLAEDTSITFEELVAYKHSTRLEAADHIVQDLVAAARAAGDSTARAAADVLESWDRTTDAESRGAVLFTGFLDAMRRETWPGGSPWDVGWIAEAPLATPDGLAAPVQAAALLSRVAAAVDSRYGAIDVPWGSVYRLRRDTVDLPASGGPSAAGAFRVLEFAPLPDAAPPGVTPSGVTLSRDAPRFQAIAGDSYIAAVEFSSPLRAVSLLTYGNASQPGSPHRTDQLELFAQKQMKPVWFTRAELEPHVVMRETF